MTPRRYGLFLNRAQTFGLYAPGVILALVMPVFFLITFAFAPQPTNLRNERPPAAFLLVLLFPVSMGAYQLWSALSMPREIEATSDNILRFNSRVRSQTVAIPKIQSIEPANRRLLRLNVTIYVLTHADGKILFPGQFTGLHILLSELKQANPRVNLTGC